MKINIPTKQEPGRIKTFLKRIQQLAWFELLDKWFTLGIKLFWVGLLVIFGIYLRKEYKKDTYYIQNFKVPPAWVEQGYSGDVVKQAIIDDIDNVINSVYSNDKAAINPNEDGVELLSDFSVEGFNLKAITKSLLAILGKKHKNISGYITINDSTQTVAIQVTAQITQPLSIPKNESAQKLIRKATIEIMKVKSPRSLMAYYMAQEDTVMARSVHHYISKHREVLKDYFFYDLSIYVSLYDRKYDRALAWADSLQEKYPNDKLAYFDRAIIYPTIIYLEKPDSAQVEKYNKLYVENLLKALSPSSTSETENNIDQIASMYLSGHYYSKKDYKSYTDIVEKASLNHTYTAAQNNYLAYAYIYQKNYAKAEKSLQRTLFLEDSIGDYWDSLAEVYSLQRKDSLAVVNLAIALKCSKKLPVVSVEYYRKDPRWQHLRKRADFQKLMEGS